MPINIPVKNIYIMFLYAWRKHLEGKIVKIDAEEHTDLQNLSAKILNNGLNHLFKRGLTRDYRSKTDDIKSVKGKINFNTTIKKNLLMNGRVNCEFDEFDEDNIQNQIIKATISKLIKTKNIDQENKNNLIKQKLRFSGVSDIRLQRSHFSGIRFNANNNFYDFLLRICKLIFESIIPSEEPGRFKFKEPLNFETDKKRRLLFEDFVREFYKIEQNKYIVNRKNLNWGFVEITDNSAEFVPEMKTDMILSNENKKIIIDTKFTQALRPDQHDDQRYRIKEDHLYQIYAYMKNTEVSENQSLEGMLLYPSIDGDIDHQFIKDGNKISVKSINLNQDFEGIKTDLKRVIA